MITLAIVFLVTGYRGLLALAIAFVVAGLIQYIAHMSFGGISGDVMGASNEIVRLFCPDFLVIYVRFCFSMIAVIMCGGKGSRFITQDNIEKPLARIRGKTLIETS